MLNCTSANVGNTCSVQSNGCYRVSGCDVSKKYYDTNSACILANTNKSCARDERSGCYKVTGCDNSQGYYDTREEVTAQFPGYNIIESNGCFARGTAKTCPDGEYTSCAPKTGNTVVKNETGNYAGPSACGTCVYTCNTSLGYYKDNQTCTADNYGKTCSLDKASDCYKTSGCNTALGYYGTVTLCENAFKGYNCIADNGCYTKGTAKDCPVGEYLKGNCPKKKAPPLPKLFPAICPAVLPATPAVTAATLRKNTMMISAPVRRPIPANSAPKTAKPAVSSLPAATPPPAIMKKRVPALPPAPATSAP